MTPRAALSRSLGWMASAASAAALLSGMAFALAAQRDAAPTALMLDLSQRPPAAPAVAAVSDAAPQAVDEAPDQPAPAAPLAEATPDAPLPDTAPELPAEWPSMTLPEPEVPAQADLAVPPPPPEEVPEATAKAEPKPKPKPLPNAEKTAKPEPEQTAARPKKKADEASSKAAAAAAGAAAPKTAEKATGAPKVSAASYAKSVMKKVRSTKKKKGAGRGSVTVGFTVAKDGGLASVKVLNSSGNADLDRIALDHIRRAAPFPPPPEGVGRNFSFEFVGK